MLEFIVICVLLYLGYRILRWAFSSSKGGSRRSGGGDFFDFGGDGDSGGGD